MTKIAFFATLEKLLEASPKFGRRILNGLDYDYLESWLRAGIAPESITEGIIKSLQNFRPTPQNPVIRRMAYFEAEIFAAGQRREENQRCVMN